MHQIKQLESLIPLMILGIFLIILPVICAVISPSTPDYKPIISKPEN
jgi:hypothetical protein